MGHRCHMMSSWLRGQSFHTRTVFPLPTKTNPSVRNPTAMSTRSDHLWYCSPYAKPLMVLAPKYLLHHKACVSSLKDMATGTYFQRVITEGGKGDNMPKDYPLVPYSEIKRVIFCSGKVNSRTLSYARHNKRCRYSISYIMRGNDTTYGMWRWFASSSWLPSPTTP